MRMLGRLALAVLFALTTNVGAKTLFDTGRAIGVANYATYRLMADTFSLDSSAWLTGATIEVVGVDNFTQWDGTAEYFVFADANGQPGDVLAHGRGRRTDVEEGGFQWNWEVGTSKLLSFRFTAPIKADSDVTYWFGMHLQRTYDATNYDDAMWMYASEEGHAMYAPEGDMSAWTDMYTGRLSFVLQGVSARSQATALEARAALSPIPEPASGVLLIGGLLALAYRRHATRR